MSRSYLAANVALAASLLITGYASATGSEGEQRFVVDVKATDVELHTVAGAKVLALRIRNAAARACGSEVYPLAVRDSDGFIACREAAIDRAVGAIGSPLLAAALDRSQLVVARSDH